MNEATQLLERHVAVVTPLTEFAAENPEGRPSRRARVQLRQWAEEELAISEGTGDLLREVRKQGADSVPFLLATLEEDHLRMSEQMGSPNYEAGEEQVLLGNRLIELWKELIEALRTEAMRDRPPMDSSQGDQQQDGEQQDPPLVSLAAEIQLLMRLEISLHEQMERMVARREILSQAGIELDEDDLRDIDRLVERQSQLRTLFESIVKRLEEPPDENQEEEI